MNKPFDLVDLVSRIKGQGLPVAEENAKVATALTLGWVGDSAILKGGLFAMAGAGIPYVQQQLIALEDKIDGVAGDAPLPALVAGPALVKAFDVQALVERFKLNGLTILEADAKLLTGIVLDWTGDSCVAEGGLAAMIAPGIPYLKQQLLALEEKIAPAAAPAAT